MLNSKTHISQAEHNEQLVKTLAGNGFADWEATALFYAALHYVDSYFSGLGLKRCKTHTERDRAVSIHLPNIWGHYRSLKDWSLDARYECEKPDQSDLDDMSRSLNIIKLLVNGPA